MKREILKVGKLTEKVYNDCIIEGQLDCFDFGYNYDQHFYDLKLAKDTNTPDNILRELITSDRLEENAVIYWICRNDNTQTDTLKLIASTRACRGNFRLILSHRNCSEEIKKIIAKKFSI